MSENASNVSNMSEEVSAKPKRSRRVQVRIVKQFTDTALVEWRDAKTRLRRAVIPCDAVEGDKADEETLQAGVPYGLPWEEIEVPAFTPEVLANILRESGIWTSSDLLQRSGIARAAITSVIVGDVIRKLINLARGEIK